MARLDIAEILAIKIAARERAERRPVKKASKKKKKQK